MVPARYDRSTALAWVCEESGDSTADEDGYQAFALFRAHVESDELPEWFEQGPDRAPAEEAIAWARARAAKVIVRCCETWENTFYSAGEKQAFSEEGPLPDWPKGGLDLKPRRLPGWEHLDRTADDEPIQWEVIAGGDVFPQPAELGPAFEAALGRDRSVAVIGTLVSEPHVQGRAFVLAGDTIRAHLRLTARTVEEATALATAACSDAAVTALSATSSDLADHLRPEWRADASRPGRRRQRSTLASTKAESCDRRISENEHCDCDEAETRPGDDPRRGVCVERDDLSRRGTGVGLLERSQRVARAGQDRYREPGESGRPARSRSSIRP